MIFDKSSKNLNVNEANIINIKFVNENIKITCYIDYIEHHSISDSEIKFAHNFEETFEDRFISLCKNFKTNIHVFNIHSRGKDDNGLYYLNYFYTTFSNITGSYFKIEGRIFDINPSNILNESFKDNIFNFIEETITKNKIK